MSRIFEKLIAKRERLTGIAKGAFDFLRDLANGQFRVPEGVKKYFGKLKGLSPLQKLVILTVAVCLPAGFVLAAFLIGFMKGRKKRPVAKISYFKKFLRK